MEKRLAENYLPETREWFAKNLPDAKWQNGEAVATTNNLYMAMKGSYLHGGTEYIYCYDCTKKEMYLEEPYQEYEKKMKEFLVREWDVPEDRMDIRVFSDCLDAKKANDNPREPEGNMGNAKI